MSFSDTQDGWAFYNGELRHGSNNEGPRYGEAIKAGDVITVIFDTIEVSFRLLDAQNIPFRSFICVCSID